MFFSKIKSKGENKLIFEYLRLGMRSLVENGTEIEKPEVIPDGMIIMTTMTCMNGTPIVMTTITIEVRSTGMNMVMIDMMMIMIDGTGSMTVETEIMMIGIMMIKIVITMIGIGIMIEGMIIQMIGTEIMTMITMIMTEIVETMHAMEETGLCSSTGFPFLHNMQIFGLLAGVEVAPVTPPYPGHIKNISSWSRTVYLMRQA